MQMSQIVFLVAVLASVLGGFSFYFWRRSASLYALLVEGANRYEELRHRASAYEAKTKDQEGKVREFHQKALQADKAATEARSHSQELAKAVAAKAQDLTYVTDKLERQKGYLEGLVEKQTEQIRTLENERQLLETSLTVQQTEAVEKIEKLTLLKDSQLTSFKEQLKSLKNDFERSQQELHLVTKKVSEADPVEMKRLRRKISQYARLYITMKGLKELAEERSHNWEVALGKLSTWVIHQKQGPKAQIPKDLGPLIGTALKATGQQLIYDDEVFDGEAVKTPPADSMGAGVPISQKSPSELDAAAATHLMAGGASEGTVLSKETPKSDSIL